MMKRRTLAFGMAIICCVGLIGCGPAASKKTDQQSESKTETQVDDPVTITENEESDNDIMSDRIKVDPNEITYADQYSFDKIVAAHGESVDFDIIIEAESESEAEGVNRKSDTTSSEGMYVDISDNKAFAVSVTLPASQFYKITIAHRAGSHKENPILFNGTKVCDVYSEKGEWIISEYDGIYLEKGENAITLGEGWSWFSLDYIRIQSGNTIEEEFYRGQDLLLTNPYANLKTQNVYQYLQAVYGKRTLAGQCTDYGHNTETDALYLGVGKYPAVRTFDFIYDSIGFCKGNPSAKDVALAKEWSAQGGLVVFDWHWYAPVDGCAFYTKDTDFRIDKAIPADGLDLTYMPLEDIRGLYREEKISLETVMLFVDIDNISGLLQDMEDADVTVLWRPLHEASGGWFWWGATGPDDYKWLWKTLYERMTNFHQLDNLIWVWNAQDPDWYPGDAYCDIAALDVYGPSHDYGVSPTTLKEVNSWVNGKKMVTMSECATMPDPDLIVRDNAYWLWFAVWNWDYLVVNGTTELSEKYTELEMMKKVYNSDVIITLDELPKF